MRGRLAVLYVTAFVDMVGLTMIVPLLPFYATDFGATATAVGILISAFSIAQLAVAPAWGSFSDRYGRRPAILAGLLVSAFAYGIFALAASVPVLLLARLVQGAGGGTIGVVQAYVADTSTPERRTRSLGWLSAVTSLGAVAGPAFGSAMIAIGGRTAPGVGAAALSVLVAIFAWRFLGESHTEREPQGAAGPRQSSRAAIARVAFHWNDPAARLIWIYAIGIGAFYGTIQIVPLLLSSRLAVSEENIGYFIMYLGAMGVFVRTLLLGPMVDRLGEARLSGLGIVILAAGLAATGLAHDWPLLAAGFTLMPLGTAFLFPCVTGLLSRVVPASERGLYMGVQHTFGGVSRVIFPIAAGALMDLSGVGVPYLIAAALVLATLPLTRALSGYLLPPAATVPPEPIIAAADITAEIPVAVSAERRAQP